MKNGDMISDDQYYDLREEDVICFLLAAFDLCVDFFRSISRPDEALVEDKN